MVRVDDSGAYKVGNVRIVETTQRELERWFRYSTHTTPQEAKMSRQKLPNSVQRKIAELDEQVEYLTRKLANTDQAITESRRRLTGTFANDREYADLREALADLVNNKPILEKKLHTAQRTLSRCKAFIDELPAGTVLEPVSIDVKGFTLADVRAWIEEAQNELKKLRAAPTPSDDIEQRVKAYVEAMGRLTITGIGKGEKLKVVWPGAARDFKGPVEQSAELLPMMALLHPNEMVEALMREVDRMADVPIPRKERPKHIAELERKISHLRYIEGAICAATSAEHSPSAPPEAVLQVKLVREAERAKHDTPQLAEV
jgi:hypothetical protein